MRPVSFLAVLVAMAPATQAAEPPAALTHHRCYICHSDREALVGPSFADVANAYRDQPNAAARIATEIRAGIKSGGPWHMPPHPEISSKEAREMARYIMSLKPEKAAPKEVRRSP
jgi:cytochrome c551/c552